MTLPRTGFQAAPDNPVYRLFMGRVQLVQADSWLFFRSRGKVRKMMHNLKYRGAGDLGPMLGNLYGYELSRNESWVKPDVITCVPMHPSRLKKRGYNQAELLAGGFSSALNIPFRPELLKKIENRTSQTGLGRFGRWENISGSFQCSAKLESGHHVGVFDDVITTGSTLEACCRALAESGVRKISVFSLCVAER